jgi:hypothetical protein
MASAEADRAVRDPESLQSVDVVLRQNEATGKETPSDVARLKEARRPRVTAPPRAPVRNVVRVSGNEWVRSVFCAATFAVVDAGR